MWTGPADTIVEFRVTGPLGEGVRNKSSGFSNTADSGGDGKQEIDFGSLSGGTFAPGKYTIVETLKGTTADPMVTPSLSISTTLGASEVQDAPMVNDASHTIGSAAAPAKIDLDRIIESATFKVVVPIQQGETIKRDTHASRF